MASCYKLLLPRYFKFRLNNVTLRVRLFNRVTPKTVVLYIGTIKKQYK